MFEFSKNILSKNRKRNKFYYYIFLVSTFLLFIYFLLGIIIDERVLMMWRNHSEGVPNALIDNIKILSEGGGDVALRLRRRFRAHAMCREMSHNLQQIIVGIE